MKIRVLLVLVLLISLISIVMAEDKVYTDRDLKKYDYSSSNSFDVETFADTKCGVYLEIMKTCETYTCRVSTRREYEECKQPAVKVRIVR